MGRPGHALSPLVPDVGPVRHPRDDRPRSPRPQERPRARRGRPAALAGDDLHAARDRRPPPLHPAGHELSQRLRLRQHALRRRGRAHRSRERHGLGGLHRRPHPEEGRPDLEPAAPHGGDRRPERRHPPRRARRQADPRGHRRERQHERRGRDPLLRRRHGPLDEHPPRRRQAPRRDAALRRADRAGADLHRDAHPDQPAGAGSSPPNARISAATPSASGSATTAAASSSTTPGASPATFRAWSWSPSSSSASPS